MFDINWKPIIETLLGHEDFHGYKGYDLVLMSLGFIFWAKAYYHIIYDGFKYKVCEMPMLVASGNIAWEFAWSFIYHGDLDHLFKLGCRSWFCMDLFINYLVLRYSRSLVTNAWMKKYYYVIYLFYLGLWFYLVVYIAADHDDNELGIVSALLINVVMSSLYIYQLTNNPEKRYRGFNYKVAWWKMAGTGAITLSSVFLWPHNGFLITMGVASFLLDVIYIYIFKAFNHDILAKLEPAS